MVWDRDCDLTQRREGRQVSVADARVPNDAVLGLTPSRIPQANPGAVAPVLIRQPRADLTTIDSTTTGTAQDMLPANEMRCYFLIQNTGTVPIRVAFGTSAAATRGLLLNPGATYEAPVAPTNSVSVFGAAGGRFAMLYANDKRPGA